MAGQTVVLFAEFFVKPEHRAPFLESLLEDIRGSREDEPGCLRFDVAVDDEDPNRFLLFEEYTDAAPVDAHIAAPHFKQLDAGLGEWLAQPGVATFATRVERI